MVYEVYMILNRINLNGLLVFEKVYELNSMTRAAAALAMTQPGVSQHIHTLEQDLNLKLFVRDRKTIIPTKFADNLYKISRELIVKLESTLADLTDDRGFLASEVVIGVPEEFGNNILMPKLAQLHHSHPQIKFKLIYGFGGHMNELLQQGKLDFAFLDDFENFKGVVYQKVYEEELILCCTQKYIKQFEVTADAKQDFEIFSYVSYVPEQTVLKQWFQKAMGFKQVKLNSVMVTEDTQAVWSFIRQNMGVGIIPRHMFEQKSKLVKLHSFNPKYKKVHNAISLAYLEKRLEGPFMSFMHNYLEQAFAQM